MANPEGSINFSLKPELRSQLEETLENLRKYSGRSITRSAFIQEAIYYYLCYLYDIQDEDAIVKEVIRRLPNPANSPRSQRRRRAEAKKQRPSDEKKMHRRASISNKKMTKKENFQKRLDESLKSHLNIQYAKKDEKR